MERRFLTIDEVVEWALEQAPLGSWEWTCAFEYAVYVHAGAHGGLMLHVGHKAVLEAAATLDSLIAAHRRITCDRTPTLFSHPLPAAVLSTPAS